VLDMPEDRDAWAKGTPMPDEAFELVETIPNDALLLEQLPSPDADGTEVWRFADRFNGFKYWGSLDRCAEVANQHFISESRFVSNSRKFI
jgi:hypothetical protein